MADVNRETEPVNRTEHFHSDKYGTKFVDKSNKLYEKAAAKRPPPHAPESAQEKKGPAGGFDSTPIPHATPGYTLKITFHRAINLPFSDFNSLSSDPYVVAQLNTELPMRHKQDPRLRWRTPTIRRNVNPEWEQEWIVANVPASGFALKCRVYDEDPADHDDRLGNAHLHVNSIGENWPGVKEQHLRIKKRMGSKRAYLFRACAAFVSRNVHMSGELVVSVEVLGKTEGDEGGRCYTIGPCAWSRHYSPLIGRLAGTKATDENAGADGNKKKVERYNFQAIQIQLKGPVPAPLYHRYVEFKPFVAGMFTSHSLRGRILNRALHHQHARIYNYDRSTLYGSFAAPSINLTKQFLELVHYDQGGRIFTYVLTLDGQLRFTETGKEFGIDLLSKHTMHSDVSIYIAFSGEFFVRRLKHPHANRDEAPDPSKATLPPAPDPELELEDGERPHSAEPSTDPHKYELVIDNDSGTYRPNADLLPQLRHFLSSSLPGLRVATLDCQKDEETMQKLKGEQREKKQHTKDGRMTYLQNASDSSLSSSDEEALEGERNEGEDGVGHSGGGSRTAGVKGSIRRKWQSVKEPKKGFMEYIAGNDEEKTAEKRAPADAGKDAGKATGTLGKEDHHAVDGNVIEKAADGEAGGNGNAVAVAKPSAKDQATVE